jgi:YbgC/YbaW family acyl-CoA thioester hydrolase
MTIPFRTTRRVEFCDTDLAGIVHFSNFFRYMESAEAEFLRSRGLSVAWRTPEGEKLGFPRVAAACDYFKPARFEDVLEIGLSVKVGRKSVTYTHEFRRGGELLARGRITAVFCRHLPDGRFESIEVPADIRAKLQAPE